MNHSFYQIMVPHDLVQYVQLEATFLQKSADLPLMQKFILHSVTFQSKYNGSAAEVELMFQRNPFYYLLNMYLPTLSLLAIVEVTLLFNDSKQDIAVNLSLTVMLVIYTFYQSLSENIPETSYVKIIDIWLIFCLLVPFATFLVESACYLNYNQNSKKFEIKEQTAGFFNNTVDKDPKSIKTMLKYGVIAFTMFFICVYFSCCVLVFFYP